MGVHVSAHIFHELCTHTHTHLVIHEHQNDAANEFVAVEAALNRERLLHLPCCARTAKNFHRSHYTLWFCQICMQSPVPVSGEMMSQLLIYWGEGDVRMQGRNCQPTTHPHPSTPIHTNPHTHTPQEVRLPLTLPLPRFSGIESDLFQSRNTRGDTHVQ
jgi:hypothetical protein